ncbi:hypothetical protein LCGC14_1536260 [marine sediment metagenome]|uniref:Uncharacterized protein n=1 Tax=marine sediment metagenome TaxID=412755 RepID=A0A0F9LA76_9ZZZZ
MRLQELKEEAKTEREAMDDVRRIQRRNLIAVKRQSGGKSFEEVMLATPNLYVVEYRIRGSRINGTFLVNAKSKSEANQIVKAIDLDYTGMKAQILQQAVDEMGIPEEWLEYFIPEMGRIPEPGQAEFIDAGT